MTSPQEPQSSAGTPDVPGAAPESTAPTAAVAVAIRGAACLLGAGCVAWATVPSVPKGFADFALFLAILGVAAGALRLALAAVPVPEDNYLLPAPLRAWLRFLETLRLVPWEELALIAILWLEVLHPSQPWHTAVLGAALIGYLLATHLAESDASPQALRPQVRVLAAGAALLALGAGAGMLPASGPGAGSALLRLVAAGALIAAAGLVLPYVARGDTPPPPPA
jgi:AcrR family transcriptional regulator